MCALKVSRYSSVRAAAEEEEEEEGEGRGRGAVDAGPGRREREPRCVTGEEPQPKFRFA